MSEYLSDMYPGFDPATGECNATLTGDYVWSPKSHAAIVARELGIPAVVNCTGGTMRLRTGDRVIVDGVRGTVEIMERADRSVRVGAIRRDPAPEPELVREVD